MSITIDINKELEKALRDSAAEEGLDLQRYIVGLLNRQLPGKSRKSNNKRELELLQEINKGVSTDLWDRYETLKERRDGEQLTSEEYQELTEIIDQIEMANAHRMKALFELSKIRGTSIDALMKSLGLQAKLNA